MIGQTTLVLDKKGNTIGYIKKRAHSWKAVNTWGNTRYFRLARNAKLWVRQSDSQEGLKYLQRLESVERLQNQAEGFQFIRDNPLETTPKSEALLNQLLTLAEKHGCERVSRSMLPSGSVIGQFDFFSRRFYVDSTLAKGGQTHTLAHELAHYFDHRVRGLLDHSISETEQLVEAVAYAVLNDHGIDTTQHSAYYIYGYQPKASATILKLFNVYSLFHSEEMKNAFLKIYNEFSFELDHVDQEDM